MIGTGSVLTLKELKSKSAKSFLVENFAGKLLLAQPGNPYARLHAAIDGLEYKSGTPQSNNLFSLNEKGAGQYSLTTFLRDKTSKKDIMLTLGVDAEGVWHAVDPVSDNATVCTFHVEVEEPSQTGRVKRDLSVPPFEFEKWQVRRLLHEGYLQVAGVVDCAALDECLAMINHELGLPGRIVAGGIQEGEALGKLAGNLSNCSAVRGVLAGKMQSVLNAVFGEDNFENSNLSAQIAMRFPELNKPAELESSNIGELTAAVRIIGLSKCLLTIAPFIA